MRGPLFPVAIAVLTSAGCTPEPEGLDAFQACEDVTCLKKHVEEAWTEDSKQVRKLLLQMDDDLVRAVLVGEIAQARPQEVDSLCGAFDFHSLARTRCLRLSRRPHLKARHDLEAIQESVDRFRKGGGPRGHLLPLPEFPDPEWAGATAEQAADAVKDCADAPDLAVCAQNIANRAATDGDLEEAGLACRAGHPEGERDYGECLFLAAESAVEVRGLDALEDGLRLCEQSVFGPFCVTHLIELSAPGAPAADAGGRAEVEAAIDAAAQVRQAAGEETRRQDLYEDFFWSLWIGTAFQMAEEVRGDLLEVLPERTRPYVRFSAATRVFRHEHLNYEFTLDKGVSWTRQALARREPLPERAPRTWPATTFFSRPLWDHDKHDEREIRAIYAHGAHRRPTVEDPDLDLRIAVLEAAARADHPPAADFFFAFVGSEEPELVRWTGARIGTVLDPEGARALAADPPESETSSLVLDRLVPRERVQEPYRRSLEPPANRNDDRPRRTPPPSTKKTP